MRPGAVFLTAKGTGLDHQRAPRAVGARIHAGRLDLSTEES